MKPELVWLLWAVALTFAQMLVAVGGATLQVGLPVLAGNREGLTDCKGWAGRAARGTGRSRNAGPSGRWAGPA